jgi:hypothetical protein
MARKSFDIVHRMACWLWPIPWTLLGLAIGIVGCISGGRIGWYNGTIVCWGPRLNRLLQCVPISGGASAITLGHTILARSESDMVRTHDHELVHVRQYQRWGILFVPAYFIASLWLWYSGQDCYRENPFEKEAFQEDSTRIKLRT